MPIIDAQVHVYEADSPEHPWAGAGHGPAESLPGQVLGMMDDSGVDRAVLVSPWSIYRYDASYAIRVARAHPDRFTVVAPVDFLADGAVSEVRELASTEVVTGLRVMLIGDEIREAIGSGAADGALAAIAQAGLPLCVACPGELPTAAEIARRHPDLHVVIDHLGLRTSFVPPAPADTLDDLPALLALADLPNVAVKATGLPAISHEAKPWHDVQDVLSDVIDAFGADRTMWGTDWTRTIEFLDYADGIRYLDHFAWTDDEERNRVLGGTAERLFGGPAT